MQQAKAFSSGTRPRPRCAASHNARTDISRRQLLAGTAAVMTSLRLPAWQPAQVGCHCASILAPGPSACGSPRLSHTCAQLRHLTAGAVARRRLHSHTLWPQGVGRPTRRGRHPAAWRHRRHPLERLHKGLPGECVWGGGGRGRGCTGAAVRAGVLRHNQLLSSSRARQARKQHSRGSTHTLVGPAVTAVLSTPAPTLPKCPAVSCCVGAAVLQGKRIDNTSVRDEPYLFVLGGQQVRRREAHTASTSPLPLPGWHPACPVHLAHTPSMHCPWVCCTEAAH